RPISRRPGARGPPARGVCRAGPAGGHRHRRRLPAGGPHHDRGLAHRGRHLRHPDRRHHLRPAGPSTPEVPHPPRRTPMSNPTIDPTDPAPSGVGPAEPVEGQIPDGPVEPTSAAEDEVIAELEESLGEAEHNDLYPYQAIVLTSFGGPEAPEEVMPFLRRVTSGRGIPDERLEEVAGHYVHFGGRSPINDQNRALIAALREELDRRGRPVPGLFGHRNSQPLRPATPREDHGGGLRPGLAR